MSRNRAQVSEEVRSTSVAWLWVWLLGLLVVTPAWSDDLEALMASLSFSSDDVAAVRAGELVSGRLESASDRELAVAVVVKTSVEPARLVAALAQGRALSQNPKVKHFESVSKPMGPAALKAVTLTPDQVKRWRRASPGEDINLSADEFQILNSSLAGAGGDSATASAVEQAVEAILQTRMQMYQLSGLDGIASYERSSGDLRDASGELRLASQANQKMGLLPDEFYDVLLAYPDRVPAGFQETFFWTLEEGPGTMLLNLTHRFSVQLDEGYGTVQRQFYVSNGYNVEQAISRILPVEGGSVLLYTNRTSTDQVDGFGGSARRSIGDRMMESELSGLIRRILDSVKSEAP